MFKYYKNIVIVFLIFAAGAASGIMWEKYNNNTEMIISIPEESQSIYAAESTVTPIIQNNNTSPTIAPTAQPENKLININTATSEELQELKGIGEKKAQAIIDDRTKNGAYTRIEEIMRVSGIGEKTFENLKDFITVN